MHCIKNNFLKIKNIILIYFRVKNTLKNNRNHTGDFFYHNKVRFFQQIKIFKINKHGNIMIYLSRDLKLVFFTAFFYL